MTRGVNLGGWLLLEKWMTPSLFTGLKAEDEFSLCQELDDQAEAILNIHRDHFITEQDFRWIAEHGLTAVRLPVGYWIFGDELPYIGGIAYVDLAFQWAERYHLGIVLDLHGAPGSQNGRDHSGSVGDVAWSRPYNIAKSLKVIERLAERYKGSNSLLGIELLNEPTWHHQKKQLRSYYKTGYETIRRHCGTKVAVVVSDAFHPRRWKHVMQGSHYQNTQLDMHLYQVFSRHDKKMSMAEHITKTVRDWGNLISTVNKRWSIVIGEWSLALDAASLKDYEPAVYDAAMRAYGAAQLLVFEQTDGWFYWTYRTEKGGVWSYRDCVQRGWLPVTFATPEKSSASPKA